MAPMIDVVFQLLIFFMLTLKITKAEGDFQINMPVSGAAAADAEIPMEVKIYMSANPDGSLNVIQFGERQFPASPTAFDSLNSAILRDFVTPGGAYNDDLEVTIEFDYNLHYDNVVQAVSAATGRVSKQTGQPVRFIERIKLAEPRGGPDDA